MNILLAIWEWLTEGEDGEIGPGVDPNG